MAQHLRVFAAFAENLSSSPSTPKAAHNRLYFFFRGSDTLFQP